MDYHAGAETGLRENYDILLSASLGSRGLISQYGSLIEGEPSEAELSPYDDEEREALLEAIDALRATKAWGSRHNQKRPPKTRFYKYRNRNPKVGVIALREQVASWASEKFGVTVTARRVEAVVKALQRVFPRS